MPEIAPGGSSQIAEIVARQLAETLAVPVAVLDERGGMLATSMAMAGDGLSSPARLVRDDATRRVPFATGSKSGEVLIGPKPDGTVLDLQLAGALVEQAIRYALVVQEQPSREELRNSFLHDLLEGRWQDETTIRRQGAILGLHFAQTYGVFILDAAGYVFGAPHGTREETTEGRIRQHVQVVLSHLAGFARPPHTALYLYIGEGEFAVLPTLHLGRGAASGRPRDNHAALPGSWNELDALKAAARALLQQLNAAVQAPCNIGVSRYHAGLLGLARAYREARFALETGRRLQGPNGIHALDTLGAAAFVAHTDGWLKADLARRLLAPLDGEPVLRQTLDAFFAAGGVVDRTALQLGIHRNTLRQRLDRVQALTGLNPRHIDDALQIRCAMLEVELSR